MSRMVKRIGARVSRGVFVATVAVIGLIACGKDSSPDSATAEPDPSAQDPGADPDGGPPPEPVQAGDPGSEGPPLISGFDPITPPPLSGGCTPGDAQPCQLDQLCMGVAHCAEDGTAFGACQCDATPALGGGIVGAACESNDDCSGGVCLRADGNDYLGAGGPAGGYCTFACSDPGGNECAAHDPQSRCVGLGPNQATYCIRTCLSKDAEPGEAKCLNRSNLVCESIAADGVVSLAVERQDGVCVPRCGSDAECPSGRVCHRQGGICTDVRSPGAPTGSSCTLDTNCDGKACEGRVGGVGTCTAECVLGALAGCGYAHDEPLRKAACLTALVSAGRFSEGPGDLGLCQELCDVDADCLQAANGFVCRPLNAALASFTGRSGGCVRAAN
jgi:hypothetical protein